MTDFAHLSEITSKLLKQRLPFFPKYGFFYIVSCDHWIFENSGKKCYKFGITSQSLSRRCQFYDVGKFGNLTILHYYACTNAKRLEDIVKTKVEPHIKKGKEWVDLDLSSLKEVVESVLELDPFLQSLFQGLKEYRIKNIENQKGPDSDVEIDLHNLTVFKNNVTQLSLKHCEEEEFHFALPKERESKCIKPKPKTSEKTSSVPYKNICYDASRQGYRAYAQYNYRRETRCFKVAKYTSEKVALEKALEWQQSTISKWREEKQNAKRSFEIPKELETKIKEQKGIRIDRHNGNLIVFVQRENLSIRKMFSYRENSEKAFELACKHRNLLVNETSTLFRQRVITNRKKRKGNEV